MIEPVRKGDSVVARKRITSPISSGRPSRGLRGRCHVGFSDGVVNEGGAWIVGLLTIGSSTDELDCSARAGKVKPYRCEYFRQLPGRVDCEIVGDRIVPRVPDTMGHYDAL